MFHFIKFRQKTTVLALSLMMLTGLTAMPAHASDANEHFLNQDDFNVFYLPGGAPDSGLKNWDPSDTLFKGQITCTSPKCVTVDEAVNAALTRGYPKRENMELVFQARQRIYSSLGHLLPRLQIDLGVGLTPTSVLGTVSNLLGFLMPSNWFTWKESKLFYAAQKSSYAGILKSLVTDTRALYYNIHRVSMDLLIYDYYAQNLQKLIDDIKSNNADNKVSADDLLLLENLKDEIKANASYLNTVISSWYTYDVAVAMAYPNQGAIGIQPLELPDLSNVPNYTVTAADVKQIKANSSELLSIRYLIKAAGYERLTRIFSFLSTGGNGRDTTIGLSFGLDNVADVRISSSEKRNLEIQSQEMGAKLEDNFRQLVDVHNGVTDLYRQYVGGKVPNRALFYSVLGRFSTERTLDTEKLIHAIDWALSFELNRNFVQHLYLNTKSQMDKMLGNGLFSNISSYVPANGDLNPRSDRIKLKENVDIDRDIKNGKLDLTNP